MDKNKLILPLCILLGSIIFGGFYYISERDKLENKSSNFTSFNIIKPDQELKDSFNNSVQHSAMTDIAELSCFPTSRFDCSLEGCTSLAPKTFYFIDYGKEDGTYFRCDTQGCDSYPIKISQSGSFTQFTPSLGQSMLFKIANDGFPNKGEFVDIATISTNTIVSFGKCDFLKK